MTVERFITVFAGFFIMLSLALGVETWPELGPNPLFHSSYWLFFTAFVGFNLFQSGFTGFCPLAIILKQFGIRTEAERANGTSS